MIKTLIKKIVPAFLIGYYHFCLSFLAAVFYSFPSRGIKVIGITGTNGKSTTADLTTLILKEAGYKVALLSSVKFQIQECEEPNSLRMTMPGRFFIQRFLRKAVTEGCQYVVLEVTSEGIKQFRHQFINFEAAVLTNLTPEHIEAHGGFENYKKAKGKLFSVAKNIHIINLDDDNANYFLQFPAKIKYGYGIKISNFPASPAGRQFPISNQFSNSKSQIIVAKNPDVAENGLRFFVDDTEFRLKLIGEFNIYNSLAAICVGISHGISSDICKKALEKAEGVPGRMELVISEPFQVFVDYAFTPNALGKVYQTLSARLANPQTNKLICVLGSCGGGRDKWKRPVLGQLAGKYCKEVIVTNEDPYDEDPMEIINQVADGAAGKARKILDRGQAIREALASARPNDIVVITGKGSEPSICIAGGKQMPWDDRRVVRAEFKNLTEI